MAGFNFREFGDLLAGLRRDVETLKRKAAGGVVTDIELMCYPGNVNPPLLFGGPNGGLVGFMYRHGQFANIQVTGVVSNTNSAAGTFYIKFPFVFATPVGAPAVALMTGGWRATVSGSRYGGEVFPTAGTDYVNCYITAAVSMTSPGTWASGDAFSLFVNCVIAPGY